MDHLIILNKNDLRELLREMIPATTAPVQKTEGKDYLSFEEGLVYLNDRGIRMSKSTLYKKTADKEIPFRRFGIRKIVFEPELLDKWINDQLSGMESIVCKTVVESARRKERRSL